MTDADVPVWSSATPSPAVLRAGAILDIVAEARGRPLSIQELAAQTGVPRSSLANLCSALMRLGFLSRSEHGFLLGRHLLDLSNAYLNSIDVVRMFMERCRSVGPDLEETAQLAVIDGLEVVYIARYDGPTPVPVKANIGRRLPAYSTALGKAILAGRDLDTVEKALRALPSIRTLTPGARSTVKEIMADLRATQERGYGINDEETTEGIFGVAMRIEQLPEAVESYAVSISMLKARATPARVDAALRVLKQLAVLGGD